MEAHRVALANRLVPPVVEQPQYNLFERTKVEADYSEIYKIVGLGTTIWSPLASGLLTGKYNEGIPKNSRFALEGFEWLRDKLIEADKIKKVKKLSDIASKTGLSLAIFSIAWCLKNKHVTTAILGATRKQQLLENLKAIDALPLLTDEVMAKVEKVMLNKPEIL